MTKNLDLLFQESNSFHGCEYYKVLNYKKRNTKEGRSGLNGDNFEKTIFTNPDWRGSNWYRFEEPAGTQIPETKVPYSHCGSLHGGWIMTGKHPKSTGTTVDAEVCFSGIISGCASTISIKIHNCGSYYVYHLDDTLARYSGYCAV